LAFLTDRALEEEGHDMAGVYGGPQSIFRFCKGSARSLHKPFDFPYLCFFFEVQSRSQQQRAENFLNTSNHFHALEMATFAPISYAYVPTAPRSKSAAARCKPASSILNKLNNAALDGPRLPATAAADNDGGFVTARVVSSTTSSATGGSKGHIQHIYFSLVNGRLWIQNIIASACFGLKEGEARTLLSH
jgi:hypothetical protein